MDRPRFKANNRLNGTPEENQAAVQGTVANLGTWSVDEGSRTLVNLRRLVQSIDEMKGPSLRSG